jgi:hypothetical protein
MVLVEATVGKRDYIKEWVGDIYPDDDIAEKTERRLAQLSNPEFDNAGRVHDWRNHVGEATKSLWHTFTDEQKAAIAVDSDERASREEWE